MVITVTCPACSSSFPVDSAKVPPKGVNARCTQCGDVFRIEKPPEAAPISALAPDPPDPSETAGSLEEMTVMPPPSVPDLPEPEVPETPAEAAPSVPPTPEPAPEAAAEEPASGSGFRFGKRDPTDKAKRLARVLVSDMIMYNADRHTTALENGTLEEDFEEEIEKSWKEFVEQVGSDIAEGPGRAFWTDALNDILAKGEKLF